MSASREKQLRQEQAASGALDTQAELKKEQAKKEKRSNTLYIVIAAAFLLALVASVVWRSNIISKNATAVTVDGVDYNAAEMNFYYWNGYNNFMNENYYLASYMGLNSTTSPKSQVMTADAASMLGMEEGTTWHDYFLYQAQQQMAVVQVVLDKAEAEGYTYTDSVQTEAMLQFRHTALRGKGLSQIL